MTRIPSPPQSGGFFNSSTGVENDPRQLLQEGQQPPQPQPMQPEPQGYEPVGSIIDDAIKDFSEFAKETQKASVSIVQQPADVVMEISDALDDAEEFFGTLETDYGDQKLREEGFKENPYRVVTEGVFSKLDMKAAEKDPANLRNYYKKVQYTPGERLAAAVKILREGRKKWEEKKEQYRKYYADMWEKAGLLSVPFMMLNETAQQFEIGSDMQPLWWLRAWDLAGAMDLMDAGKAYQAGKRIASGEATTEDYMGYAAYLLEQEREQNRPWLGFARDIGVQLPAYAFAFGLTRGAARGGAAAATKLARSQLEKRAGSVLSRTAINRLARGVGYAALPAARMKSPLMYGRALASIAGYSQDTLGLSEDAAGRMRAVVQQHGYSIPHAIAAGLADTYLEFASEEMGGALTKGISKAAGGMGRVASKALPQFIREKMGRAVVGTFAKLASKLNKPEAFLKRFYKATSFNGILGEYLEERAKEAMAAGANVTGLGLQNQGVLPAAEQALAKYMAGDKEGAIKDLKYAIWQSGAELVGFAPFAGAGMATSLMAKFDRWHSTRVFRKAVEKDLGETLQKIRKHISESGAKSVYSTPEAAAQWAEDGGFADFMHLLQLDPKNQKKYGPILRGEVAPQDEDTARYLDTVAEYFLGRVDKFVEQSEKNGGVPSRKTWERHGPPFEAENAEERKQYFQWVQQHLDEKARAEAPTELEQTVRQAEQSFQQEKAREAAQQQQPEQPVEPTVEQPQGQQQPVSAETPAPEQQPEPRTAAEGPQGVETPEIVEDVTEPASGSPEAVFEKHKTRRNAPNVKLDSPPEWYAEKYGQVTSKFKHVNVRFYSGPDAGKLHSKAFVLGNTVYINSATEELDEPDMWKLIGHELAHATSVDKAAASIFSDRDIQRAAQQYLESKRPQYVQRLEKLKQKNPERYNQVLQREAVAHLVQGMMTDQRFRDELIGTQPGLVERILKWIASHFGIKLTGTRTLPERYRRVADLYKQAMQQPAPGAAASQGKATGAVQQEQKPVAPKQAKPAEPKAEQTPEAKMDAYIARSLDKLKARNQEDATVQEASRLIGGFDYHRQQIRGYVDRIKGEKDVEQATALLRDVSYSLSQLEELARKAKGYAANYGMTDYGPEVQRQLDQAVSEARELVQVAKDRVEQLQPKEEKPKPAQEPQSPKPEPKPEPAVQDLPTDPRAYVDFKDAIAEGLAEADKGDKKAWQDLQGAANDAAEVVIEAVSNAHEAKEVDDLIDAAGQLEDAISLLGSFHNAVMQKARSAGVDTSGVLAMVTASESMLSRLLDQTNAKVAAIEEKDLVKGEIEEPKPETPEQTEPRDKTLVARFKKLLEDKVGKGKIAVSDLQKIADEVYGGTMAEGQYSEAEMFDALETAVNLTIQGSLKYGKRSGDVELPPNEVVENLTTLVQSLPTQTRRSGQKQALQQFSTPPHLAYLVARAAAIDHQDIVLEPSAGTGGIVVHAQNAGAKKVYANEIQPQGETNPRVDLLREIGPDVVWTVDAENIQAMTAQVADKPTVVVMNPPFSSDVKRRAKQVGLDRRHVDAALEALKPGGRLVSVMGAGIDKGQGEGMSQAMSKWLSELQKKYQVAALIRVKGDRVYRKYGTSFDTYVLVVDKIQPKPEHKMLRQSVDNISDAIDLIERVRNERALTGQDLAGPTLEDDKGEPSSGAKDEGTGTRAGAPGTAGAGPNAPGAGEGTGRKGTQSTRSRKGAGPTRRGGRSTSGASGGRRSRQGGGKSEGGGRATGGRTGAAKAGTSGPSTPETTGGQSESAWPESGGKWLDEMTPEEMQKFLEEQWAKEQQASAKSPPQDAGGKKAVSKPKLESKIEPDAPKEQPKQPEQKQKPQTLEEKKAAKKEELLDEFRKLADMVKKSNTKPTMNGDPEIVKQAFNVAVKAIQFGYYNFAQMVRDISKSLGRSTLIGIEQPLIWAWNQLAARDRTGKMSKATSVRAILREKQSAESVYEPYVPAYLPDTRAIPHPGSIDETASLANTPMPEIDYVPQLPDIAIQSGNISDMQLETIAHIGATHERRNGDGTRAAALSSDGTGTGKTHVGAGVIMDNWQRGRKKHVWVTTNKQMFGQIQRAWERIGGNPKDVHHYAQSKQTGQGKKGPIEIGRGILVMSYAQLGQRADPQQNKMSTIEQVQQWMGPDFDGVIILDEAHYAKNLDDNEGRQAGGRRGGSFFSNGSERAKAVMRMQEVAPDGRILFLSATPATEVKHIKYALGRLGFVGRGAPFQTVSECVGAISSGGLHAMEAFATTLKAMGRYFSRSLSMNDGTPNGTVVYRDIEHKLSDNEKEMYDTCAQAWNDVRDEIKRTTKSRAQLIVAMSRLASARQRFMEGLLAAFHTQEAIRDAEKQLEAGHSVIFQVSETGQAMLERAQAALGTEDVSNLRYNRVESLINFVQQHFPVIKYETVEVQDALGNVHKEEQPVMVPVVDDNGNPVLDERGQPKYAAALDEEKVRARDALIEKLEQINLAIPMPAIDQIINHRWFGRPGYMDAAEITTRKERLAFEEDEDGNIAPVIQRRSNKRGSGFPSTAKMVDDFQDGRKRIMVIGPAGFTGHDLHADITRQNQQHRVMYVLQTGWSADSALQALGRAHRSNQANAPEIVSVSTDVAAHKRFRSTLARRFAQIGAMGKGSRKAASSELFNESDDLETPHAQAALNQMHSRMQEGWVIDQDTGRLVETAGTSAITAQMLDDMANFRLFVEDKNGQLRANDKLPTMTQFLNRLAALPVDMQNAVFNAFMRIYEQEIERAKSQGEYDTGLQVLDGRNITVQRRETVYTHPDTGAKIEYVELERTVDVPKITFDQTEPDDATAVYLVSNRGQVWRAYPTDIVTQDEHGVGRRNIKLRGVRGSVHYIQDKKVAPRSVERGTEAAKDYSYFVVDHDTAKDLWAKEYDKTPTEQQARTHLFTGAVLLKWHQLADSAQEMVIAETKDGDRILGTRVPQARLDRVLQNFGLTQDFSRDTQHTPEKALDELFDNDDGEVRLRKGFKVRRVRTRGEKRIEVTASIPTKLRELDAFTHVLNKENANYMDRYFIPYTEKGSPNYQEVRQRAKQAIQELTERFPIIWIKSVDDLPEDLALEAADENDRNYVDDLRVPNPHVERHMTHAGPSNSFWATVRRALRYLTVEGWRTYRHIPEGGGPVGLLSKKAREEGERYATTWEAFRLLQEKPRIVRRIVSTQINYIVSPMKDNPRSFFLFQRLLLMRDIYWSMVEDELPARNGFERDENDNPRSKDFAIQQAKDYLDMLEEKAAADPIVQAALERRQEVMRKVIVRLVHAGELDEKYLEPERMARYWHRQVMDYLYAAMGERFMAAEDKAGQKRRVASGGSPQAVEAGRMRGAKLMRQSFQMERYKGEEPALPEQFDIFSDYIASEYAWLYQGQLKLELKDWTEELDSIWGATSEIKKEMRERNFLLAIGGEEGLKRLERLAELIKGKRADFDRVTDEEWEWLMGANVQRPSTVKEYKKMLRDRRKQIDPTLEFRRKRQRILAVLRERLGDETLTHSEAENDIDFDMMARIRQLQKRTDDVGRLASAWMATWTRQNQKLKEVLGEQYVTLKKLLRQGRYVDYKYWSPKAGSPFYRAYTIGDHLAEALIEHMTEEAKITEDDLRQVLVFGGQKLEYLLPSAVVDQLEHMERRATQAHNPLARLTKRAISLWKVNVLANPMRVVSYSLRNLSGDIEPILTQVPGILKYLKEAILELMKYYAAHPEDRDFVMTPDMRITFDYGAVNSGFALTEMPSLETLGEITAQMEKMGWGKKAFQWWWHKAGRFNEFRENILRYAAFKYYVAQLEKDPKLSFYGGSRKSHVQRVLEHFGPDITAAKLARELLLDYTAISENGQWLRTYAIPFWAFMELNARRFPQLQINAIQAAIDHRGPLPAKVAIGAMRTVSMYWFTALFYLFNAMSPGRREMEMELSEEERANPHLILYRGADGRIVLLRNMGSIGDFAEWFGIPTLLSNYEPWRAGQVTTLDVAKEMMNDPVNKFVNALGPHIQIPVAALTGTSSFPDWRYRRQVHAMDELFGSMLLKDLYREASGRLLNTGQRADPDSFVGWATRISGFTKADKTDGIYPRKIFGVSDPRRYALFESYALMENFNKKIKQRVREHGSETFKYMRDAVNLGNFEAFREARRAFIAEKLRQPAFDSMEDVYNSFKSSLDTLDPMHKVSHKVRKQFLMQLTSRQRQRLWVARDYAHELKLDMWAWWQKAAEMDDSPQEKMDWDKAFHTSASRLLDRLVKPMPVRITAQDRRNGIRTLAQKRKRWQEDRRTAINWLRSRKAKKQEIISAYDKYLRSKYQTPATRVSRLRAAMSLNW